MKHRIYRLLAAFVLFTAAGAVTILSATPAQAASCPQSGPTYAQYGHYTYEGVNIRSGPTTGCVVVGAGYSSHTLLYRCYTEGTPVGWATTWTYLTDLTTGVTGWSSDYYLSGAGSWYHC